MYVMPVSRGAVSNFDSKDCTVRALANAANISYNEAHEKMQEAGRKPHKGANQLQFGKVYLNSGFVLQGVYGTTISARYAKNNLLNYVSEVPAFKGTTLKKFLEKNQIGSFIAIMRGHAFAIVDGDLIDKTAIKENTRICIVFEKV